MTQVMVRYRVKPDRVAENECYIKKVFEQLDDERPTDAFPGLAVFNEVLVETAAVIHRIRPPLHSRSHARNSHTLQISAVDQLSSP